MWQSVSHVREISLGLIHFPGLSTQSSGLGATKTIAGETNRKLRIPEKDHGRQTGPCAGKT